ncbi:hypothetical protein SUGI_1113430 [Cryptomeria japonica]|uniref:uncharacterized protein LOC131049514 n=1 Tax=Cryptomeria japonica TaxID=3369 RepID=UPI002414773D|nr:uncharacterized protein LOC131049514 [Cryptomeria japonica]XP_057839567.1 uncharacterized protein LOC131049514 [Cryptomeria japonica]XP_057839568.1 uncharacterized protein LOC131049514 [Cryptomeria japonica]XP_057839569.1 uncharacterized protein LOC131049514 [Cryptomeria japonica]GLJ52340.1 hypothetical protein SUGI_1113430 [Cryptomeria japonica]
MNSIDSMNENGSRIFNRNPVSQQMPSTSERSSSATAESSSDSGNTEKISTPPSVKQQKKSSPNKNKSTISTPSKPSSSVKRPRERQEKEGAKPSSKKSRKPALEDNKGKAAGAPEAEKSAKKNGPIWNAKDEAAFLKRLVACCEKGKGLPKNLGVFYETVRKDLDGDYTHDQLYNKLRGLKAKFGAARDKIKDKGFVGFKNAHEETVYRMSKQVWGNREEEEEVGSEKAGKGGDARVDEKKKVVVVDLGGEREEVKRNKNGVVDMAVQEQEGEEEEDEDETDDEEGGEGHGQGTQNENVNLAQHDTLKGMKTKKKEEEGISHISESVRNRVAGTGTQRSEVKMGEEKDSSEDNLGEDKESSGEDEESESESTDDDNSALRDSNAALKLPRSNVGNSSIPRESNSVLKQSNVRDNSTQHVSNGSRRVGTAGHYDVGESLRQHDAEELADRRRVAATGHHDVMENLTPHVSGDRSNGSRRIATTNLPNNEENFVQHVSNGMANGSSCVAMADQHQLFNQLCKENLKIFNNQLLDMLEGFKHEILNMVKKELQVSLNTARATSFDFSTIKGFSSARELPSLSNTEVEMLDQKWETQQLIEMEAASKRLALMQEEHQLRMAKLRHK